MTNDPPKDHSAEEPTDIETFVNEEPKATSEELTISAEPSHQLDTRQEPLPRRGPGIFEAVAWCFGFHFVQFVVMIGVIAAIFLAWFAFEPDTFKQIQFDPQGTEQLMAKFQGLLFGSSQALTMLAILIATRFRWGSGWLETVSFKRMNLLHFLAVFCLVFPMQILSQVIYENVNIIWELILEGLPALNFFNNFNMVEEAPNIIKGVSLASAVLIFSIAPAVSEELVFRGVIGRGLVNRYGLVVGMVITSILFGMVHIHPVHAIAVMPLGMVIHWLYVTTRSIWAPMLLHFLNNGFALAQTMNMSEEELTSNSAGIPVHLTILSLLTVLSLSFWLWKSRQVLRTNSGKIIDVHQEWKIPRHKKQTLKQETLKSSLSLGLATLLLVGLFFVTFFLVEPVPAQDKPAPSPKLELQGEPAAKGMQSVRVISKAIRPAC